ncbi:MAG: hypothetical protein JNN01_08140 [Opitutaceae bacterium]|nr:hypothetical protein [Opitutaceae bacterium]
MADCPIQAIPRISEATPVPQAAFTTDVQASITLPWSLRRMLGVNKAFDRLPPATRFPTGYAEYANNLLPCWIYLSVDKIF